MTIVHHYDFVAPDLYAACVSVRVEGVFHEFGERNVRSPDQALAQFTK